MKSLAVVGLLALGAAWAVYTVRAEPCASVPCSPDYRVISWERAAQMKQTSGRAALLLDIRSREKASLPPSVDRADIRFVEHDAEEEGLMTFRTSFAQEVDDQLRAEHLTHSSPVIIFCDDIQCAVLAAKLLREHGYEDLYVVSERFEAA